MGFLNFFFILEREREERIEEGKREKEGEREGVGKRERNINFCSSYL